MARNLKLKTRDITHAGYILIEKSVTDRNLSYSSKINYKRNWRFFCSWAKRNGVNKLEKINHDVLKDYSSYLKRRLDREEIAITTCHLYISAVNSVMKRASSEYQTFSPTIDGKIPNRNHVRDSLPNMYHRDLYEETLKKLTKRFQPRKVIILKLAREFGLRAKECSLLDAKKQYKNALERNKIDIETGAKGGRFRDLNIINETQINTLREASILQGEDPALIPSDVNYKNWYHSGLKKIRKALNELSDGSLHDLRAAYACERYKQITDQLPPCSGNLNIDKSIDKKARKIISKELGHNREAVAASYIGTRRLKNEKPKKVLSSF